MKRLFFFVLTVALLVMVFFLAQKKIMVTCTPEDYHIASFTIDEDFEVVRKILVRSDALGEIVAASHGKLLDEKLDVVDVKIKNGWLVSAKGRFKVDYEGDEITLNQEADIWKDQLISHVELDTPTGRLKEYELAFILYREGNKTLGHICAKISVSYTVPFTHTDVVKTELEKATKKSCLQTEQAIRDLVEKHKGTRLKRPRLRDITAKRLRLRD